MKQLKSTPFFIPDYDTHFEDLGVRESKPCDLNTYQHNRVETALKFCKKTLLAVDVGAHIGLITTKLCKEFDKVVAFEPNIENYECLLENTKGLTNIVMFNQALSFEERRIDLINNTTSSGEFKCVHNGKGTVSAITLDSLELDHCNLIKLDVQGYEWFVLRGARKTIRQHRPVIILEEEADKYDVKKFLQKHHNITAYQARTYLTNNFGYKIAKRINHDYILVP